MNTDYIRSLLIMFNNRNVYEIETALAIYEYMDKGVKEISEEEIFKVYDLIHSQDDIYDSYIKEEVLKIKEEYDRKGQIDNNINEKEQEDLEKWNNLLYYML